VVVLFDLRRITRRPNEARMHRSDVAGGLRVRSQCCHRRGVLSVHLSELHRVLDRVRLGAIEAWNAADESHARAVTGITTVDT
jgi:hypothetical protein